MSDTAVIRLPYALLPWQKEVKRDRHRFRVVCAGRRSGKSVLGCDDLTQGAATVPGSVNWYIGPTYTAAKDIAWEILKANIEPFRQASLIEKVVESDLLIRWRNGAIIHLKGGDKPDSLRGVKLSRLVIDEYAIMKREIWDEVLQPATSDNKAPVLFISTPKGYNHFYDAYCMAQKSPGDWYQKHIKTSEAGTLPTDEIERARRDMDPRAFRQEYEATFETFGGQVYTDFDRTKHVPVDPIPFSPSMEYVAGMDFGWSSPSFVSLMNIDAQENVFIFAEISRRETPVPEIARLIKAAAQGHVPSLIGCDPAGAAKSEAMGLDAVSELRTIFGLQTIRYRSNYPGVIQDGINQIRKWLRNGKLKISKNCPQTIQAFEMYRYPDPKDNVQSELPLKDGISDHAADSVRYLFAIRFPLRKSIVGAA